MLWVKAFHIIFMGNWVAGVFYLPRLFVYHAQSRSTPPLLNASKKWKENCFGVLRRRERS